MKKKYLIPILVILFVFLAKASALTEEVINVNRLKDDDITTGSLQGFCYANNEKTKIVRVVINTVGSNGTSNVEILDTSSGTPVVANTVTGLELGHGNDCTYNPNTDEILFVTNNGLKKYRLSENNLVYIGDVNLPSETGSVGAIAYDKDHDHYIIYRGGKLLITDSNFIPIGTEKAIIGTGYTYATSNVESQEFSINAKPHLYTSQGIGYWNNYIYTAFFENGNSITTATPTNYSNLTNFEKERFGGNTLYIFDLEGNFIREFFIPKRDLINNTNLDYVPEMESVDFDNKGNILLGFTFFYGISNSLFQANSPTATPAKYLSFWTSNYILHDKFNIKNISISQNPTKLTYIQNYEDLDLTGGKVLVTYMDDSSTEIDLANQDVNITGFDNTTTGTKTLTINYANKSTNLDVSVVPKQISRVEIKQAPIKKTYIQNYEDLDLTGGILKVTYNDTSTDEISLTNKNIIVSGFNNATTGTKTLTVNYGGVQTTFNVEVVAKQLSKIEMIQNPTKLSYIQNYENLDLTGGILKVTYNDTSTDEISLTNEEIEVSGFNNSSVGSKTITVKYKNKTCTFNINVVNKSISQIEIKSLPIKSSYIRYLEDLDLTGGVLKVTYNDTSTDEISMLNENIKISGFDNTNLGEKTIKVTYENKEVEFKVNVIEIKIDDNVVPVPNTNSKYSLITLISGVLITILGLFILIRKIISIKNVNNI